MATQLTGQGGCGFAFLFCYALGLGIWFMAFGAFFGWIAPRMRRLNPYLPRLMVVSGAFFIVLGALMFLGQFTRFENRAEDLPEEEG